MVGLPGIEPGLHAPHACVLPVYYSPLRCFDYNKNLMINISTFVPINRDFGGLRAIKIINEYKKIA